VPPRYGFEQRERRVVGAAQRIEQFGCAAMVSSELQPVRLGQFALPHPGRSGASQPHRNLAVEPGIGNVSARVVREFGFVPRPG
jgi:hypothetical protein